MMNFFNVMLDLDLKYILEYCSQTILGNLSSEYVKNSDCISYLKDVYLSDMFQNWSVLHVQYLINRLLVFLCLLCLGLSSGS